MIRKDYLKRINKLGNQTIGCNFCGSKKRQSREHLVMR